MTLKNEYRQDIELLREISQGLGESSNSFHHCLARMIDHVANELEHHVAIDGAECYLRPAPIPYGETQSVGQSTLSKRPRMDSAVYTMNETASLFGMGYTTLWEQMKRGEFPIQPLQVGRQYKFPKAVVDRMLMLGESDTETGSE